MATKSAGGRKQDRARVAGGQDYEVRYESEEDRAVASQGEERGEEKSRSVSETGRTRTNAGERRSPNFAARRWEGGPGVFAHTPRRQAPFVDAERDRPHSGAFSVVG